MTIHLMCSQTRANVADLMATKHSLQMDGDTPAINQGEHHGRLITYNPDDERFYVHAPNEGKAHPDDSGGAGVLGMYAADPVHRQRGWINALQCARRASIHGDNVLSSEPGRIQRLRHSFSPTEPCKVCNAEGCRERPPWTAAQVAIAALFARTAEARKLTPVNFDGQRHDVQRATMSGCAIAHSSNSAW
jgi:hypothetical protein